MEEFFTRDNANKGIKIPLYTAEGKKSEHTITVLGVDSDKHHETELQARRKILEQRSSMQGMSPSKQKELAAKVQKECNLDIIAGLIGGWTFEKKCTHENKVEFLTNAPQIAEEIDIVASDRKRFFKQGQNSSKATQK